MKKYFIFTILLLLFGLGIQPSKAYEAEEDVKFYKKYGNSNKLWNAQVEQGFEAYGRQDCDSALQALKEAVGMQCQDGLVYYKLAVCSEKTGNTYTALQYYQLAEEKLGQLKSIHTYQKDIFESYGRALFKAQKYKESLPYLTRAASFGSPNFGLYYMIGLLYSKNNDSAAALDYFQRALAVDTSQVPPALLSKAYFAVGKSQFENKDYPAAKISLDKAIQLDPTNAPAASVRSQNETALQQASIIDNIKNLTNQVTGAASNGNFEPLPMLQPTAPSASPGTPSTALPSVGKPPASGGTSVPTTLEPLPPVGGK